MLSLFLIYPEININLPHTIYDKIKAIFKDFLKDNFKDNINNNTKDHYNGLHLV